MIDLGHNSRLYEKLYGSKAAEDFRPMINWTNISYNKMHILIEREYPILIASAKMIFSNLVGYSRCDSHWSCDPVTIYIYIYIYILL